jgi:hypothetical protein
MKNWPDKLASLALVFWVGGLWAIGYLAAPSLFSALPNDRALAGALAGKMFTLTAYVGMGCALYLIIHRLASVGTGAFQQLFFWVALLMLVLTLVGVFGVQPIIASLKMEGGARDVMQSVAASRFAHWHGVASILYLIQSLLGAVLVLKR